MNGHSFAALTRRASLVAMTGAGMMSLPRSVADAKRKNKKRRNDGDKKARKKCQQQGDDCTLIVETECGNDQTCLDDLLPCCEFAGRCDVTGVLNCFFPVPE